MFEDRTYKRTFYSAPQSVTSLVAAFMEPAITVIVFLFANSYVGESVNRPELTLTLLVFALAVVLTPLAIAREAHHLLSGQTTTASPCPFGSILFCSAAFSSLALSYSQLGMGLHATDEGKVVPSATLTATGNFLIGDAAASAHQGTASTFSPKSKSRSTRLRVTLSPVKATSGVGLLTRKA